MPPHFSVVIPAHNEQLLLPRALAAIHRAADQVAESVELIGVTNRCTDATADIAAAAGAIERCCGIAIRC